MPARSAGRGDRSTTTARRTFGYLPEERGLYPSMKVLEQLRWLGQLRGLTREVAHDEASRWLAELGLAERAGDELEDLSLGNQQRVQLIGALLHQPDVLVLDEPFSGLDPVAVDALSKVLVGEARRGATVLFSSHQLDLVEDLCERAVVVDRGRVVAEGTIDELTAGRDPVLEIDVPSDPDGAWTAGARTGRASSVISASNGVVRLQLPGGDGTAAERAQVALDAARRAGPINRFAFERRSLAEVFMAMVGRHPDRRSRHELARVRHDARRQRARSGRPTRTRSFRITLLLSAAALARRHRDRQPRQRRAGHQDGGAGRRRRAPGRGTIEQLGTAAGVELADDHRARRRRRRRRVARRRRRRRRAPPTAPTLTTEKEVDLTESSSLADVVNVLRSFLALQNGLRAAGLSPEQAAAVQSAEPPAVDALEPEDAERRRPGSASASPLVINILLFIMLQTYGQWVVTAVTREKASRVVEVLLAVIRPRQLLDRQAHRHRHRRPRPRRRAAHRRLRHGADHGPGDRRRRRPRRPRPRRRLVPARLRAVLRRLRGGRLAGVAGSRTRSRVAFPIMLPLLLGYIVSFSAAGGASLLLWILAFFPPTAILAMPTLYAVGEAPLWAVFLSMAITAVAVVVVAMLAAKIYERSVLRTGKKLSWREAFRLRDEVGQADRFTTAA